MRAKGLVSVIIPCFNYGRFLSTAIESALGQTYRPVEVIVVNDGSTDDTEAVCRRYGGRIVYMRQERGGVSAARNAGVRRSGGEWLQFLDADDAIDADKISVQAAAGREPDVGCVCSGWREVTEGGKEAGRQMPDIPERPALVLLQGNRIAPVCALVRREAFDDAGGFDEDLRGAEDWELFVRIAWRKWRFVTVRRCLGTYLWHGGNVSANLRHMVDDQIRGRDKIARLVAGDAHASEINRLAKANLCLMGSYISQVENRSRAAAEAYARSALETCEPGSPRPEVILVDPLGAGASERRGEAMRRLRRSDEWAYGVVAPLIAGARGRAEFLGRYAMWVCRSLRRNGFRTMARGRMLRLLASRGRRVLVKDQKTLAVGVIFGPRAAEACRGLLRAIRRVV